MIDLASYGILFGVNRLLLNSVWFQINRKVYLQSKFGLIYQDPVNISCRDSEGDDSYERRDTLSTAFPAKDVR